jgi:type II secretory pathway component PulJ
LKASNRTKRPGFTLFEIILVVAGASMIVATCAMLLHVLLRLDTVGRSHLNDASTVSRLARQFREDVRTASKADRTPESNQAPRLTLTTPGAPTVIYQVESDRLLRLESLGDKVVRRESYSIARLGPVAFEGDGGFIRLVLLRKPDEPGTAIRPRARIDARLGKHRTLSRASEPKS